jgi:nucleoside-diphosphate-sugar epimerase
VIRQERQPGDQYLPSAVAGGHFDLAKIRALKWEPTTGIEEGFRRTVESYE